jgi:hypothetical protein
MSATYKFELGRQEQVQEGNRILLFSVVHGYKLVDGEWDFHSADVYCDEIGRVPVVSQPDTELWIDVDF